MRHLTPAGFLLAALLFLIMPGAAASCDVPAESGSAGGTIGISLTGADLALAREKLVTSGGLALTPAQQQRMDTSLTVPAGTHILAVLATVIMILGAVTTRVRPVRWRASSTLIAAGIASALLVVIEYLSVRELTRMAEDLLRFAQYLPVVKNKGLDGRAGEVVSLGLGFWLPEVILVLLIAVNLIGLAHQGRPVPRRA